MSTIPDYILETAPDAEGEWQQDASNPYLIIDNRTHQVVFECLPFVRGREVAERLTARIVHDHAVVSRLVKVLRAVADEKDRDASQLDAWATQSREGGWSTHQVDPMQGNADKLRREASQIRSQLAQIRRNSDG
jgi:hypothetical protein